MFELERAVLIHSLGGYSANNLLNSSALQTIERIQLMGL